MYNRVDVIRELEERIEGEKMGITLRYEEPGEGDVCLAIEGCHSACLKINNDVECIVVNKDYDIENVLRSIRNGDDINGRTSESLESKTD
ncbi:MAG: hypothetical protein ACK5LL_11895 [Suipraeoptans sp.]